MKAPEFTPFGVSSLAYMLLYHSSQRIYDGSPRTPGTLEAIAYQTRAQAGTEDPVLCVQGVITSQRIRKFLDRSFLSLLVLESHRLGYGSHAVNRMRVSKRFIFETRRYRSSLEFPLSTITSSSSAESGMRR